MFESNTIDPVPSGQTAYHSIIRDKTTPKVYRLPIQYSTPHEHTPGNDVSHEYEIYVCTLNDQPLLKWCASKVYLLQNQRSYNIIIMLTMPAGLETLYMYAQTTHSIK